MNEPIIRLWINALKSGDYLQGVSCLRYIDDQGVNHWCCLGVLCQLYYLHVLHGEWKLHDEDNVYTFMIDGARHSGMLPKLVAAWAGIDIAPTCMGFWLSDLNDGLNGCQRHSFESIAQYIEQELERQHGHQD
jgi:hypothetical protein